MRKSICFILLLALLSLGFVQEAKATPIKTAEIQSQILYEEDDFKVRKILDKETSVNYLIFENEHGICVFPRLKNNSFVVNGGSFGNFEDLG